MAPRARRKNTEPMAPPPGGATVRMYRQGHGDCFLVGFARTNGGDPVYVLIDCGYKPGSQIEVDGKLVDPKMVLADIASVTKKKLDVVVVTHEHQDHVNLLDSFDNFEIGEVWFAWTEDPQDKDANELRRRHRDQLLGLLSARRQLSVLAADSTDAAHVISKLDTLISLELGGIDAAADIGVVGFGVASADPENSHNKRAMRAVRKQAKQVRYLRPHDDILLLPGAPDVRVYALGPPRSPDLLKDEDPAGDAAFPGHTLGRLTSVSFFAALGEGTTKATSPFMVDYACGVDEAFSDPDYGEFFTRHYGSEPVGPGEGDASPDDASWRRIDDEWLCASETFALKLNTGVNNTSLVLAFELPGERKVLLFAGDAQFGNWKSWDDGQWGSGDNTVTARDLLARTVLYKVGHHGSHNATLDGKEGSDYPNLAWMGLGRFGKEFVAFIPANREWAVNKASWIHPLPSIKEELQRKANGRVFQIDEGNPSAIPKEDWDQLVQSGRAKVTSLYIEYSVE